MKRQCDVMTREFRTGKSMMVVFSPKRRMTNDVPTSEKKNERPFVHCPNTPMNEANALVAPTGSPGCAASKVPFASTFIA